MMLFHYLLRNIPRPLLIKISIWAQKPVAYYFAGNGVEDPISGQRFRKFLPYGQNKYTKRDNVLSPGTFSLERHRLMWLFLKNETDFFTTRYKVLHIAPEQCFYKKFKKLPNLSYTTADYNSPIADVHFDLHEAPFANNSFDVVFCNHVLEHVEEDKVCMKELYRIMKPGGWGIFQVPIDVQRDQTLEDVSINTPRLREKYYWQKDHVRLYGLDYKEKLEGAGFDVEVIDYIKKLSKAELDRYRLHKEEKIYLCRKR